MANLAVEEIVVQGLARVQEFARSYPAARSVLYRRISTRQQELAAMAAKVNRDYFGAAATVVLVAGAADLNDIIAPVPTPEMIHKIQVDTIGAGAVVAVGDEVSLVRLGDEAAEESPRVTLRSGVLRQYKADLLNVTGLKVFYSKIPDTLLSTETGVSLVAIPAPYDELLVLDIAELVIERAMHGDPNDVAKKTLLDAIEAEVAEWQGKWLAHAGVFGATRSRFAR
jgi:hypothetical protein